jgi:integrase
MQAWARSCEAEGSAPSSTSLEELSSSVVLDFAIWLQNNPYSPKGSSILPRPFTSATINLYLTALRRALRMWRGHNWISFSSEEEKNYFDSHRIKSHYDPIKQAQKRAKEVPQDFGPRMWEAVKSLRLPEGSNTFSRQRRVCILRDQALIAVLVSTGLRIYDVCSLTQRDLDEARNNDGIFIITSEKTDVRTYCHLPPFAIDAIDNYLNARGPGNPYLFQKHPKSMIGASSQRRFRMTPGAARATIYKVAFKAYGDDLPVFFGPHAFRHWFAQNRINGGSPLDQVQSQLGHASPVTTKLIYAPEPRVDQIKISEDNLSDQLLKDANRLSKRGTSL